MLTPAAVKRFFRTPKGLLIIILAVLVVPAAAGQGVAVVAPGVAAAVLVASANDLLIIRVRQHAWEVPSGAFLTGLFIAMILSPHQPWYVAAITSALAIVSKYLFRTRSANVFNPAALALVATFYIFHTTQSWWGALPDLTPLALALLFATGIFITDRVNKMPLVLVFLGVYYALFTGKSFAGRPEQVAEIFRAPDLHAVLFFAFFILTDPPTSPVRYPDQIVCGALVAVASFVIFERVGAVHYLLSGVLVGNVWEAWRRTHPRATDAAAVTPSSVRRSAPLQPSGD
ncbi:MAG TPA: RnfABCDGE type electron transport complex subunit D [Vicinamibacterales bacterium]|nr:RnfABCDGE type electron transport complex subunit D [Vicinamibacterales bacterium]